MRSLFTHLLFAVLMIAALCVPAGAAHAKGPFDRLTITGPGLEAPIDVTDRDLLNAMGFMFDFFAVRVPEPANPGTGYEVTRYYRREDGSYEAFDRLVYYPSPDPAADLIYYDGIINGFADYDDYWYTLQPAARDALHTILADHGMALEAAPAAPRSRVGWHFVLRLLGALR